MRVPQGLRKDGRWRLVRDRTAACRHAPSAECREQIGGARETRDRFCNSDARTIDAAVGGSESHADAEVFPRRSSWLVVLLGAFALL